MERKIVITADGSHSLFVKELNEHYHSIHGAIQESQHVFINAGLKYIISHLKSITSPLAPLVKKGEGNLVNEINILEIGLGTGLNAILTFIEAEQSVLNIHYTSLEAFPVSIDIANKLNYVELLNSKKYQSVFNTMHSSDWEKDITLSKHFTLHKIKSTLQEVELKNTFDLIYFDAFGPPVQPEMWTEKVFSKLFAATKPNSCLVTYCAKGEVKRTLKKVGFTVESLDGPPGKREMVRAVKN